MGSLHVSASVSAPVTKHA